MRLREARWSRRSPRAARAASPRPRRPHTVPVRRAPLEGLTISRGGDFRWPPAGTTSWPLTLGAAAKRRRPVPVPVPVPALTLSGRPVTLLWLKRLWRCAEPACATTTWSEVRARPPLGVADRTGPTGSVPAGRSGRASWRRCRHRHSVPGAGRLLARRARRPAPRVAAAAGRHGARRRRDGHRRGAARVRPAAAGCGSPPLSGRLRAQARPGTASPAARGRSRASSRTTRSASPGRSPGSRGGPCSRRPPRRWRRAR